MKIKNIHISLVILFVLAFLSFGFYVSAQQSNDTQNIFLDSDQDGLTDQEEQTLGTDPHRADTDGDGYSDGSEIKSGYNPLKAGPGDKVVDETPSSNLNQNTSVDSQNLTNKVAQKISTITTSTNADDQQVSMDQIKSIISDSIDPSQSDVAGTATTTTDEIPQVTEKDIKILKQSYKNMTDDEIKKKKKEDFANYISAVYYILSSNSPKPITSGQDITSISTSIGQEVITAIETGDAASLDDLSQSGTKMIEQLKEVEVPEDLVDIHIKALTFALYAQKLQKNITPSTDDPLNDIANLSKVEGFVESLVQFSDEARTKFDEYGLTFDDVQEKLKNLGVSSQDMSIVKMLTQ
jgi:hypothetical protein